MILADKIVKLRKRLGWSQEELAEQMGVSRQSVSKWESAHSIPDLTKIIRLSELFNVSTDFLVKDQCETFDTAEVNGAESSIADERTHITQVSLEQANQYVSDKLAQSALQVKGAILCVCAIIPLFFMMAIAESNQLGINEDMAAAVGIASVLIIVSIAVKFFIKASAYDDRLTVFDKQKFELGYGVHSVFEDKLAKLMPHYQRKMPIGIFLFIISGLPLILSGIFLETSVAPLLALPVLLLLISAGIYFVVPISAQKEAYQKILEDNWKDPSQTKRKKREQAFAGFYFPLIVAIYLGWSFWTGDWQSTWIIWPVAAVLFAALCNLLELLDKEG